jgi:hypothetical protein
MSKSNPKKSAQVEKMNEIGRRTSDDRRKVVMQIQEERRKGSRRRNIDPTTCERDYKEAEIEFMRAMDDYKQSSGRMFPTCSEILEVLLKLGYQKVEATPNMVAPVVVNDNLFLDGSPATK